MSCESLALRQQCAAFAADWLARTSRLGSTECLELVLQSLPAKARVNLAQVVWDFIDGVLSGATLTFFITESRYVCLSVL